MSTDAPFHHANANVKRAVAATLDRMRAERRVDYAAEDLTARVNIELTARALLEGDEVFAYQTAVTSAFEQEQQELPAPTSSL
jgi:hypothetical protein